MVFEFNIETLLFLSREIGRFAIVLEDLEKDEKNRFRNAGQKANDATVFGSYKDQFLALGLRMCAAQIDRIVTECNSSNVISASNMSMMVHELGNRIYDECSLTHFLTISSDDWPMINQEQPLYGEIVQDKMPNVIEDIAEAGKCLGFGRSTASVFHLMRVMEAGVQKFGEALGVELVHEKVWQVILDQINKEIKTRGKAGQRYAAISAHLYNVKLAWRNEAMHPKATYTDEEAKVLFNAVRNFMINLAGVL